MNNTTTESSGKMGMPKLIKIPIVLSKKEVNENLGEEIEYFKTEARISPAYVTSYYPMTYGEDKITSTCVFVSGQCYWVDMPIDKFDKIMEDADRSYALNILEHQK